MANNESFLQSINQNELLEARKNQSSFVETGVAIISKKLKKLTAKVSSGDITIDLQCSFIDFDKALVLSTIIDFDTVSWSNLLMVQALGGDHYGYTMNWQPEVKGGCVMDNEGMDYLQKSKLATQKIKKHYKKLGVLEYLECPPIATCKNTISMLFKREMCEKWFATFIGAQMIDVEDYSVFSRSNTVAHWEFKESDL